MIDFLSQYYFWIKAFHIIAIICWMVGMLYLPRLFVYHAQVPADSPMSDTFKIMERRLQRGIMNPSLLVAFILGITLIFITGAGSPETASNWIHVKLVLVLFLFGLHGLFAAYRKDFQYDRNVKSPGYFKVLNECVTVLMVVIVILAEVKPF